jgi:hypothetical protein
MATIGAVPLNHRWAPACGLFVGELGEYLEKNLG